MSWVWEVDYLFYLTPKCISKIDNCFEWNAVVSHKIISWTVNNEKTKNKCW